MVRREVFLLFAMMIVAVSCSGVEPKVADADRQFTISQDPLEVVLVVRLHGTSTGMEHRYELFGDGSLEMTAWDRRGVLIPRDSFSAALSATEAADLVSVAVDKGLMDVQGKDISQRMIEDSGKDYDGSVSDGGYMTVELRLESYSVNGRAAESLSNSIKRQSPSLMLKVFPDYPELQGMAELGSRLRALRQQAQVARRESANP